MSSKRRVGIAHFLLRTFEMLDTPKLKHLIEWSDCGEMFYIKNSREFANKVLPQYFRHRNFQSFLRQLNMYNFVKKRLKNGWNQFQHKYFKREAKNLLVHVHRRSNGQQSDEEEQTDQQDSIKNNKNNYNKSNISKMILFLHQVSSFNNLQFCKATSNVSRINYCISTQRNRNKKIPLQHLLSSKQITNRFPKLTQTILTQNRKETDQEPQLFVLS